MKNKKQKKKQIKGLVKPKVHHIHHPAKAHAADYQHIPHCSQDGDLILDPKRLMAVFLEGNHDLICDYFCRVLQKIQASQIEDVAPPFIRFANNFLQNFFYFITRNNFQIRKKYFLTILHNSPTLTNLISLSCFNTSDAMVQLLQSMEDDKGNNPGLLCSLLFLSSRNNCRIDLDPFFQQENSLATFWWNLYLGATQAYGNRIVYENCLRFVESSPQKLLFMGGFTFCNYYHLSYIDFRNEGILKSRMNQLAKEYYKDLKINNQADKKSVAIVSGKFFPGSSVYKGLSSFVKSLASDFELTLIHLGPERNDLNRTPFTRVLNITLEADGQCDISALQENSFSLVYFLDIGMNFESNILSNVRLAPVQVMSAGHPASTKGAEIDYYLSGELVEPRHKWDYYSERLLLLPGMGVVPNIRDYEVRHITDDARDKETVYISCSAGSSKINYPFLLTLKKIISRANKKVVFRFFPNWSASKGGNYPAYKSDISEVLGDEHVEVIANKPYDEYMSLIEDCHFSVDSFPFGGYTTLVDVLFLQQIIVAWQGADAFHYYPQAVLESVGLQELIAEDEESYIELVLRIIADDTYRKSLHDKLSNIDIKEGLFTDDESGYINVAFKYLIENHSELQKEDQNIPIRFGSDALKSGLPKG